MTVTQQRQPWPSTVQRIRELETGPLVQHPRRGRIVGAGPASGPTPTPTVRRESSAMTALRAITYTLTSVASLLLITLIVLGAINAGLVQDVLGNTPLGDLTATSVSSGTAR